MDTHYLYGLMFPGTRKIVYVGVTKYPRSRLGAHRWNWPRIQMRVLVAGSREYIYALEIEAIRVFGTREHGMNLSRGGSAPPKQQTRRAGENPWWGTSLDKPSRSVSMVELRRMLSRDKRERELN